MKETNLQVGQIINVQAYKQDGTLYRQWNGAKVIELSPHTLVLFMYKTKVKEKNGQKWVVREPIIWWMPKQEFFNTTGLIRKSGTHFYTNIASPPFWEDGVIKFIDYDLDVKAYPGQKIKVVDKNEYIENSKKMNYSPKLKKIIERTTDEVVKTIQLGEAYFDEEVVDSYMQDLIENKLIAQKFRIKK